MIFTKLFNINNKSLLPIESIATTTIVDNSSSLTNDLENEVVKYLLYSGAPEKIYAKSNFHQFFKSCKEGIILGTIDVLDTKSRISLKNELVKSNYMIFLIHENGTTNDLVLSYPVKIKEKLNELSFLIAIEDWNQLISHINNFQNYRKVEIKIVINKKNKIPLLNISLKYPGYVLISVIENNLDLNYYTSFIEKNLSFYYKLYLKSLIISIQDITFEILDIFEPQSKGKIILIINRPTRILMYFEKYAPDFNFFEDVSLKIFRPQKFNSGSKTHSFKQMTQASIEIKHNKMKSIKMQSTLYRVGISSFKVLHNTYININFINHQINYKEKELEMFIEYKTYNEGFNIIMKLKKNLYLETITNIFKKFKILLKLIKIEIYGYNRRPIFIIFNDFVNEKDNTFFYTKLNIKKSLTNKTNNLIYDILKTKNGVFSVQIQTSNETIIDYKICLEGNHMRVLVSNRIQEFINNIEVENESNSDYHYFDKTKDTEKLISSSNDISNKNTSATKIGLLFPIITVLLFGGSLIYYFYLKYYINQ